MNPANKKAIRIVRDCLKTLLRDLSNRRAYSLQQESYSVWAIKEILLQLERNQLTPPLVLIEKFRDQMDEYSCVNTRTSYVFSCAKDTAEWIIDLLIS